MKRLMTMARAAALLAALILAGGSLATAQGGPDGGPNSPQAQALRQRISMMLDNLRSQPQMKPRILARMRQQIQSRPDAQYVDQRVHRLGQVLDQVVALTPDRYSTQKPQIIQLIMRILHGRKNAGGGPSGGQ